MKVNNPIITYKTVYDLHNEWYNNTNVEEWHKYGKYIRSELGIADGVGLLTYMKGCNQVELIKYYITIRNYKQ